ncbi:C4-dicarboxylate ABC transporter permease [Acuticoccus sediminis]|uniref:TRAP transporter small permease protein n=1 Tax=Acuticoccus sediminis TaxID=2184697 RepID=A0A8B2NZ68_9HYPH|nr:TRAP transporter small permease subunit [Acuticoccus sediminis]RAI01850.1 C4-dicarboxylate ABC transporter permease [Acuticoccus sediminis]
MSGALAHIRRGALGIERVVTWTAVALGCVCLVAAVGVGFYQVLARFVLFRPASWSEPFVQSALIWMTYLTLCGAMRTGTLISVDVLKKATQGAARTALRLAGAGAILILLWVILWQGIAIVWRVRFQTIAGLGVPASYVYAALPTGAALSILALVGHVIDPPPDQAAPDASS